MNEPDPIPAGPSMPDSTRSMWPESMRPGAGLRVAVNGSDTPLGRELVTALTGVAQTAGAAGVAEVIQLDGAKLTDALRGRSGVLEGVDRLVLLAPGGQDEVDGTTTGGVDLELLDRLLEVAPGSLSGVVVLSSGLVYGARAGNPLPLTEDAVLRPNPELEFAVRKAELERRVSVWAAARPDVAVSVLRPTLTTSGDSVDWMARSLWHTASPGGGDESTSAQFLHRSDLVAAIVHCCLRAIDGTYNVAPDGWLEEDERLALADLSARVRLPAPLARRFALVRWLRGGTTPPGVLPYVRHSWVLANDRLRATGWRPVRSNEEAFLVVHRPGWWASLDAGRRQNVVLGAVGVVALAASGGTALGVSRMRRRLVRSQP